ncbi:phage tail assembly chaperone family protein, TAC [Kushneria phosphatilytica]|uniref:Phage tail protein n=1 Tax=Kushneria phosphatilytica TaxID=657387 RepID=A0A1S1NZ20_9GAMM|nr:phage tail assembly chaperone family protein, TAC [Kushneria phosphatilytica]OHV13013.1 phage tail protein [Kushneria phosphatilytica]QEL10884.1 phage tail protein [Kushneria phosphatilytica]
MKLTIDNLRDAGAFTGAPVEKEISWKQGDEEYGATVHVRPLSYQTAMTDITSVRAGGDVAAARIAYCICDEQGEPVFKAADITGDADPERGPLNHNLTMELLRVISEVSGLGKVRTPSTSVSSTSSGTNSSSTGSAGARSRKRSKA